MKLRYKVGDTIKYNGKYIPNLALYHIVTKDCGEKDNKVWTKIGFFFIDSVELAINYSKEEQICNKIKLMSTRHNAFLTRKKQLNTIVTPNQILVDNC